VIRQKEALEAFGISPYVLKKAVQWHNIPVYRSEQHWGFKFYAVADLEAVFGPLKGA
jgi:hypothetical protein